MARCGKFVATNHAGRPFRCRHRGRGPVFPRFTRPEIPTVDSLWSLVWFPARRAAGCADKLSVHVAFLCLTVVCFVFARRYSKLSQPKWRAYSITTGILMQVLIVAGMAWKPIMGTLFLNRMAAFGWLTAVASMKGDLGWSGLETRGAAVSTVGP